ncbi:tripartite tricarboxylate transporter TctB family protein [Albidovulum sp.]|uniref:tripartite tricarboxylate transporter TctB family protein n=1 Tax=Albidovulum sp. TaxID=1872424 RepID=UPI001DE4DAC6|nr:tripartite tricarboxylate transporter TctB family protein [Paracoccaceae bacterium]
MIRSDRVFGLAIVLVALAMIAGALQFQEPFFASGPVGPKVFPILIAGLMVLCGGLMMARPDPEPDWPHAMSLLRIAVAVVVMVGYAYALKPFGFLLPTAIASGVIAVLIRPDALRATLTGAGLSVGLFLIFKYALGLTLVPWRWPF